MPRHIQKTLALDAPSVPRFSPQRLTAARQARELTRSQLHIELALVGVERCRALIDLWSTGASEPRANEVAALATVLRIDIDALFEPPSTSE